MVFYILRALLNGALMRCFCAAFAAVSSAIVRPACRRNSSSPSRTSRSRTFREARVPSYSVSAHGPARKVATTHPSILRARCYSMACSIV